MTLRIVRLGSPRVAGEGLRVGTVRRPPCGVPAARLAMDDWYDVWYPNLAPSAETMKLGKAAQTERDWAAFTKKFRAEMAKPEASRTLDLLAALSHTADLSIGCYCEDEARCHRSVLRELLAARRSFERSSFSSRRPVPREVRPERRPTSSGTRRCSGISDRSRPSA